MVTSVMFPDRQPDTMVPLVASLIDAVGPLVTHHDRERVLEVVEEFEFDTIASIGLELTLPPHPPACDLSILLAPGRIPSFVTSDSLRRLAREVEQREAGSTWWELDTASGGGTGGFIRLLPGIDVVAACLSAVAESGTGLSEAVTRVGSLVQRWPRGTALMGFFPDRDPAAAAALITVPTERLAPFLRSLATEATVCVDPDDSRIRTLSGLTDAHSVALGVDALGRMGVSAEFGFADRVRAMLDHQWDPVLASSAFDAARDSMPYLLATQAVHDFLDLFSLTIISGIDHCKITPDGRIKAYVGILPFQRGVGINGLPPGSV